MMSAAFTPCAATAPIPAVAGIGLRSIHHAAVIAEKPAVGWFEIHSENYFSSAAPAHHALTRIRRDYPLSLHGVGLSLGSTDALDRTHLAKIKTLVDRYEPGLVSEHLSWSSIGGRFVNDLLPLPLSREALELLVLRVDETHDYLGRQILLENVSSYLRFESEIPEHCFVAELAQRTGCGLLLDVNNAYVNQCNHGVSAAAYIDALPAGSVCEIHLAGHTVHEYRGERIVVDTHNARVSAPVWALFERAIARFGRVPALIEWDSEIPPLEVLLTEAQRADSILENAYELAA